MTSPVDRIAELTAKHLPMVLPSGWREVTIYPSASVYVHTDGMSVIAEVRDERDGKLWLHVSCARGDRLPSWEDLKAVKNPFIGKNATALQVLPPEAKYVNVHPHCLHLWTCLDGEVVPDFTCNGQL